MTAQEQLGLGELVERLRYRVNNPSAWVAFEQPGSDLFSEAADAISALVAERDAARDKHSWPQEAQFQYGDWVEKFSGEARWEGRVVSAYYTKRLALRYVVEVEPQGFQMIAVPAQLRTALLNTKENGE